MLLAAIEQAFPPLDETGLHQALDHAAGGRWRQIRALGDRSHCLRAVAVKPKKRVKLAEGHLAARR
jgi:hypothetical protein